MTSAIAADPFASLNTGGSTAAGASSDTASADRFLKLLVTQMQNQDPLNPMDNAQITSQMAQINTVTGLQTLNTSVQGLGAQFVQMQALQGATLVGRDVVVQGNRLTPNDAGLVQGGFGLESPADSVSIEILGAGGGVIDTVPLGAEGAGQHGFEWVPKAGVDPALGQRFRVVAKSGSALLNATPLMRDRVDAVLSGGDTLNLVLRDSGTVPYSGIKAFN